MSIAGIPINGVNGQFELIKDPVSAFNATSRFVELTRSVPIVNQLATNAERTALGQNQRSALANILLPNPSLQTQNLGDLASLSQLSPQRFNANAPTLTQGFMGNAAPNLFNGRQQAPVAPSNAIAQQSIQHGNLTVNLEDIKKQDYKKKGEFTVEFEKDNQYGLKKVENKKDGEYILEFGKRNDYGLKKIDGKKDGELVIEFESGNALGYKKIERKKDGTYHIEYEDGRKERTKDDSRFQNIDQLTRQILDTFAKARPEHSSKRDRDDDDNDN